MPLSKPLEVYLDDYTVDAGVTLSFVYASGGLAVDLGHDDDTPPSFTNDGTVELTTGSGSATLIAVAVGSFWTGTAITNNGTMRLDAVGNGSGVNASSWSPIIINNGALEVTATGQAIGIRGLPNYVVNTGSVVVDGAGGAIGIASSGRIENSGTVHVTGAAGKAAAAISIGGSMDLENTGTIIADDRSADQTWAVAINWGAVGDCRLVNSGVIRGDYALQVSDPYAGAEASGATIVNTGQMYGLVRLGRGADAFVNSNLVSGDVGLGGGDDLYDGRLGVVAGVVDGGDGDDVLIGGAEATELRGGAGADRLFGGAGADHLTGGEGADVFILEPGGGDDVVEDFVVGADRLDVSSVGGYASIVQQGADTLVTLLGGGTVLLKNVQAPALGEADFITSAVAPAPPETPPPPPRPTYQGTGGADIINGSDYADLIIGGAGDDHLAGFYGANEIYGGDGDDAILGHIYRPGDTSAQILDGGDGNDSITGGGGDDIVRPGAGNDSVDGGLGFSTLDYSDATGGITVHLDGIRAVGAEPQQTGGSGADFVFNFEAVLGSGYGDHLTGAVLVDGRGGDDILQARHMTGGSGADVFQFKGGLGRVYVNDFGAYGDAEFIEVFGYTAYRSVQQDGADTLVQFSDQDVLVLRGVQASSVTAALFRWHDVAPTSFAGVDGGANGDVLFGGTGSDRLRGFGGDDVLRGGRGADDFDGGTGFDTVVFADARRGVNVDLTQTGWQDAGPHLVRLAGVEAIVGSAFDDVLRGDAGNNVLNGGAAGRDLLFGGDGADTLYGGGSSQLSGDAGDDLLVGYGGVVVGSNTDYEQPVIASGGSGNDRLVSAAGNNALSGDAGDDVFYFTGGRGGADGGDGMDTLVVDASASARPFTLEQGWADGPMRVTYQGDDLPAITAWVERMQIVGTAYGDVMNGTAGDDDLRGMDGADVLRGGEGGDRLSGGAGDDVLAGGAGVDVFTASSGADVVEDFQLGVDRIDVSGVGGMGAVSRVTQQGADTLVSFAGGGSMLLRNVSASALSASHLVSLPLPAIIMPSVPAPPAGSTGGPAPITPPPTTPVPIDLPLTQVIGRDAPDHLVGGASADLIRGFAGGDVLAGMGGDDRIEGGLGSDQIYGGDGDDVLDGGGGGDLLVGGAGRDVFVASADSGTDVIDDFEVGLDRIDLSAFGDFQSIAQSGADVMIYFQYSNSRLLVRNTQISDFTSDHFIGLGSLNPGYNEIVGGAGADVLGGTAANDRLTGGAGGDTFVMKRGGGQDVVGDFDVRADRIDVSDFDGVQGFTQLGADVLVTFATGDTLLLKNVQATRLTAANFVGAAIGGSGADVLVGTPNAELLQGQDGDDRLSGLGGNDRLAGGAGDDQLEGGAGADRLDGGVGVDQARYVVATTGVGINLATGVHTGDAAGDTFVSIERFLLSSHDDQFTGSAGADDAAGYYGVDTLFGAGGNDRLDGGAGNDVLRGGEGADQLIGGTGTDLASYQLATAAVTVNLATGVHAGEAAGDTFDSIERFALSNFNDSFIGSVAADRVDGWKGNDTIYGEGGNDDLNGYDGNDVIHGGADNDKVRGDGNADELYGDAGADVLYGGTGTDQLFGGDDGDYLWGEAGNDTLTGGAGADRFAFSAGSGFDLITDFRRGQDKIVLKGLAGVDDFSDLTITTDAHGWAVISWGDAASSITLTGVAAAQLTASDVWFTG